MIEFLSSWAEQIIVAVIIATIIEMILPNNNNKKYIKIVIGIYLLFVIIHPFIGENIEIDFDKFGENAIKTSSEQTPKINQESMDKRLQELYVKQIKEDVIKKVEEKGFIVLKCDVDVNLDNNSKDKGIEKIVLKVSKNNETSQSNTTKENKEVNKVEIKIGIDKYIKKKDSTNIENNELVNLKSVLSEYYQIDSKKIIITKD